MIKNMNVRFFTYAIVDGEADIVEITYQCFEGLADSDCRIEYQRNTIFDNGVRQICLTVEPDILLDYDEIDKNCLV